MKVALCQIRAVPDFGRNCSNAVRAVERCGADLAVFPEMFLSSYGGDIDGEGCSGSIATLKETAERTGTDICIGLPGHAEGKRFSSLLYLPSRGDGTVVYDKMHIAAFPPYYETFSAGACPRCFESGGLRFGMSVCYDAMFPELYRTYSVGLGAHALIVSAASKEPSRPYMERVLPAR